MISAGSMVRGIGYALGELSLGDDAALALAQAVGTLVSRAGYRVEYRTSIPGMTPPSAGVFAYRPDGKLGASMAFSAAGLPRRSATDLAGEMLSDLEAGYIATLPSGMTEAQKEELRRIESYASPLIRTLETRARTTEENRYVNGNTYREPEAQTREPGNTDATNQSQTTSERVQQQVTEDATSGFSFGGFDTKTLLIAGAAVAALLFFGRGK
jgi:hypothetical protein